ncbi:helix-turn-helix domain-containing protein [Streptomyces sp. CAU 1734]|uniref:helix-turn-helix domain-containing protein n=1 Tax=Streptomyces sp. CAU 1734 TaxID=3140360 RepID=UPI0032600BCA
MRVHLSARTRAFTVLGNDVLQDRRLSFTARGLLAYLLSLPDGAREDVRTLADRHPGIGRRGIARALDELIELGYYVRETIRDHGSGRVRTETSVCDTPGRLPEPVPVPPGSGRPGAGRAGAFPRGKENRGKEPPAPETAPETSAEPTGRGAALLARLGVSEPRLILGAVEVAELAPLTAPWLEQGLSDLQIRSLLTAGLPRVVHSAKALLANRLVRKLPAPRPARDPHAPAAPPPECPDCREPLPLAQPGAPCPACAAGPAPAPAPAPPESAGIAHHMRTLRTALRAPAAAPAAVPVG